MSTLYNRVRVSTATNTTGTVTLGAVVSGAFFNLTEAGVADGTTVSYVLEDANGNVEMGAGVTGGTGTTCTRPGPVVSKIAGVAGTTKLTLSGSAVWFIDALAADITVPPASSTNGAIPVFSGTSGRLLAESGGLFSTSAGLLTCFAGSGGVQLYDRTTLTHVSTFYRNNGYFLFYDSEPNYDFLKLKMSNGFFGLGNSVDAQRLLHVVYDSAATNTVSYVQRITSSSSGTPAAGIGAGLEFEVETAAGNLEIGATIEAVAWDVTPGLEYFDLVFKDMSAGTAPAEKGRTGFMPIDLVQSKDLVMNANFGHYAPDYYEIVATRSLEIGADGVLEIG